MESYFRDDSLTTPSSNDSNLQMNYQCRCYGTDFCSCRPKATMQSLFSDNVSDVADAIAEVMVICGIHPCKARASTAVVTNAFRYYDEIRHRVDAVPKKRLCREDFMHDLGMKCLMTRLEAQLSYSIAKRAFKAFYHGTCEGGIHNPILEAQLIHSQECMWVHAARRTAQIFAAYEGMFLSAQRNYEALIRCAYKRLYERLLARNQSATQPDQMQQDCDCHGCLKKAVDFSKEALPPKVSKNLSGASAKNAKAEAAGQEVITAIGGSIPLCCEYLVPNEMAKQNAQQQEQERLSKGQSWRQLPPGESPVAYCQPCKCPRLICDCNAIPGIPSLECSQGPYVCRWIPVSLLEEQEPDPCAVPTLPHECPVDCMGTDDESCDEECICDCGPSCECSLEDLTDFGEENVLRSEMGEEQEIELSDEPYAGCCAMLSHIAQEMQMANHPSSMVRIEGRRDENSLRYESQVVVPPPQPSPPSPSKPSQPSQVNQPKQLNQFSPPSQPKPSNTKIPPPPKPSTNTRNDVQSKPSNTQQPGRASQKQMTDQELKKESEEINKLLASLI